jgi:hypothetical protein
MMIRRRAIRIAIGTAIVAALAVGVVVVERGRTSATDAGGAPAGAPTSRIVSLGDEAAIVLDVTAEARADIGTTPLRASGAAGAVGGVGGVSPADIGAVHLTGELAADPARGTTIRAAVAGRLSSTTWPALDSRVGAGQLLGRVSDAAPLTAPRGGTVVRVGAQPGELVQAGQELLVLADFQSPLVRIVWRPELGSAPPRQITIAPLAESVVAPAGTRAQLVGAAAVVDSLTRMPVYLYRLARAWPGARPGTPVTAIVPDTRPGANRRDSAVSAGASVLVPDAAVVQWEGLAWAFVQRGPRSYVRARVMTDYPVSGGYVVTSASSGLEPGNLVVTRGAQQLLSEEFRTHVQMSDQGDEEK